MAPAAGSTIGVVRPETSTFAAEPGAGAPSGDPAEGATARLLSTPAEPESALAARPAAGPEVLWPWLVRLRWVAVAGQTTTVLFAWDVLRVDLPLTGLGAVIAITAATNLLLAGGLLRDHTPPRVLVPGVLTLDTLLLTALLYFSGGPANSFALLYVIHVAMAAATLSWWWTWWMVGLSAACYGALFWWHVPLTIDGDPLDYALHLKGTWFAVTLVAVVTAYFVGRINQALRRREDQLASVRALAARNERLASLTTLAAGAAHELGTPLGTIAVVAKELERASGEADRHALVEDARLIRSQVDRCRRILDRLSTHADSSRDVPPAEPLAVKDLFADLRGELGGAAAVLELRAPGLPEVTVARQDLVHALAPLLHNAVDATGGAGPVELEVARTDDGRLELAVSDRGAGMAPDVLERAGEPFYTTKEPGRGTGLGLYLVRLLAERLGGSLRIESEPGAGTTATLELPEPDPGGAA